MMTPSRIAKEAPKFSAYAAEFLETYVLANNKPSKRSMKACILKHHLVPAFGGMRLDSIRADPQLGVQRGSSLGPTVRTL